MSRTKSHSSNLAVIKDLAQKIIQEVETAQTIFDQFIKDSERLKEIEPALNRLQAVLKPAITNMLLTEQPTEPKKPGDLCVTCDNDKSCNFDRNAVESCGGYKTAELSTEPVKKTRKSKKATGATTEEEPTHNLSVG